MGEGLPYIVLAAAQLDKGNKYIRAEKETLVP